MIFISLLSYLYCLHTYYWPIFL